MIYENEEYFVAAPPRFEMDDLLRPSQVLTEGQLIDIAYPPGTVPTFSVTAVALKKEGIPWWVWLLIALGTLSVIKKR